MNSSTFWRKLTLSTNILAVSILSFPVRTFGQQSGTKQWEFETGGEIYSTPAIAADGTIYFGSRDRKLYALTPAGKKKWEFLTNDRIEGSPAIGPDGTVYVGSFDSTFYAISPEGKKLWEFPTGKPISTAPAIGLDGTIYFTSQDGNLYALNPNGQKKWQWNAGGSVPSPTIGSDGTIYVARSTGGNAFFNGYVDTLYALDANGSEKWKYQLVVRDGTSSVVSSCVIGEAGRIFFVSRRTGAQINSLIGLHPNGSKNFEIDSPVSMFLPSVGPNGILWTANTSSLTSISASGELQARGYGFAGVSETPTLQGEFVQLAITEDGLFYISAYGLKRLLAIDTSGTVKWDHQTDGAIYTNPMIGPNGAVYIGTGSRKLIAINGSGGPARTLWPMYRRDSSHTARDAKVVLDPNFPSQLAVNMYAGILIQGNVGKAYRVEFVEKISDFWSPLATITLDRTPYLFFDIESTNSTKRFYRAVQVP